MPIRLFVLRSDRSLLRPLRLLRLPLHPLQLLLEHLERGDAQLGRLTDVLAEQIARRYVGQ